MALSTVASLQITLDRLNQQTAAPVPVWTQALNAADAAVKNYCHRDLEAQVYVEYRDGSGTDTLLTRQRPVNTFLQTGTLTANSAVVTGLTSTTGMLAGMPVTPGPGVAAGTLPVGTTISQVNSATQITLSANATVSGAKLLSIGLAVWIDPTGFGGMGANAFADHLFLYEGQDYLLQRERSSGTVSTSGKLTRLGGGIISGLFDFFPGFGWGWGKRGTLTARMPPTWPWGRQNVKIIYGAGYSPIPADLIQAVNQLAAFLLRIGPRGGQYSTSESFIDYSYALSALVGTPELGTTRDLLSRYKEYSL